jgi:protein-tyrosine phosphatase
VGRYVDLHAHYLPGLDDGARSPEAALQMIGAVASLGFSHLHATPHQRVGMFMPTREAIDAALEALRAAIRPPFPELDLDLGAENFWDDVFHDRLRAGTLPSYSAGRSFLFEVSPQLLPPRIEQTLFEIRLGGRLPVMAHPERNVAIQRDPARAEALGRSAALVVDLGAIEGAHGRIEMKTARRLLQDGLAQAAATDIHSPEDQRAVAAGMAWIRKNLGAEGLDRLLAENPRRILAGELP